MRLRQGGGGGEEIMDVRRLVVRCRRGVFTSAKWQSPTVVMGVYSPFFSYLSLSATTLDTKPETR